MRCTAKMRAVFYDIGHASLAAAQRRRRRRRQLAGAERRSITGFWNTIVCRLRPSSTPPGAFHLIAPALG